MGFSGFSVEALKFLFENKMRNSKKWYDAHKDIYKKYVYNPFVELVQELAPTAVEVDSKFITIPSKIISRVRRDTRFTKDKSLYRDHSWIVFLRDKSKMSTSPCFWFGINQSGSSYGVGFYSAKTATMANMRKLIIERHPAFLNALTWYESQNEYLIGGEMYKRNRFPNEPEHIALWLNRKNIYFESVQDDFRLAFSKELPEILKKSLKELKPVYDFLLLAESLE